jgi:hypothetical protein
VLKRFIRSTLYWSSNLQDRRAPKSEDASEHDQGTGLWADCE